MSGSMETKQPGQTNQIGGSRSDAVSGSANGNPTIFDEMTDEEFDRFHDWLMDEVYKATGKSVSEWFSDWDSPNNERSDGHE